VPTRDEVTERDVDPMRVVYLDGHWYLEGWCHRAEDVRLFRLDRIQTLELLDVDGTPPPQAQPRDVNEALFTPGEEDLEVVVETDRAGAWIVDYYPVDRVGGSPCTCRTRLWCGGWRGGWAGTSGWCRPLTSSRAWPRAHRRR
jgi:proteasome accessory factor C